MIVKLTRQWGEYHAGETLEPGSAALARLLVEKGYAEPVKVARPQKREKAVEEPDETRDAPPKKRTRRKSRKKAAEEDDS